MVLNGLFIISVFGGSSDLISPMDRLCRFKSQASGEIISDFDCLLFCAFVKIAFSQSRLNYVFH